MPPSVKCPGCDLSFRAPAGVSVVRCPVCNVAVPVPSVAAAPPSSEPAPTQGLSTLVVFSIVALLLIGGGVAIYVWKVHLHSAAPTQILAQSDAPVAEPAATEPSPPPPSKIDGPIVEIQLPPPETPPPAPIRVKPTVPDRPPEKEPEKPPPPPAKRPPWMTYLAMARDGKTFASFRTNDAWKSEINLWDLASGKITRTLSFPEGSNFGGFCAGFSPDGKILAAGCRAPKPVYGGICLWDVESGKYLCTLTFPSEAAVPGGFGIGFGRVALLGTDSNEPYFLAFGPRGKSLLAGNGPIWAWDVASGNRIGTFNQTAGAYMAMCGATTPDAKILVTGGHGEECVVKLWDAGSGRLLKVLDKIEGSFGYIVLSQDGKTLAWRGGQIQVWDFASGKRTATLSTATRGAGAANNGVSLALSPDGKRLASAGAGLEKVPRGVLELWDVPANKVTNLEGHTDGILGVAFTPDGKTLISLSEHDIKLWDVASEKLIKTLGR